VKAKTAAITTLVWTPRRSPLLPAGLRSVAVVIGVETLMEREVVAAAAGAGVVASPAIVVGLTGVGVTEETEGRETVTTGAVLLEPASVEVVGTDALRESEVGTDALAESEGCSDDEGPGAGVDWRAGDASAPEHTA